MSGRSLPVAALALAAAACPSPTQPTLSSIQRNVFDVGCNQSASCHSATGHAADLDLSAGHARASLVGHKVHAGKVQTAENQIITTPASAEGWLLVVPGDPGASYLMKKLTEPLDPSYGDRMPAKSGPLTLDDYDAVKTWIARGALDD